ncbi:hypothetical protein C8F01DRAFT_268963 [Mycena amicta]|nr:hypothetical protein C8F01DRAFT_268963 [Mycena amicta]
MFATTIDKVSTLVGLSPLRETPHPEARTGAGDSQGLEIRPHHPGSHHEEPAASRASTGTPSSRAPELRVKDGKRTSRDDDGGSQLPVGRRVGPHEDERTEGMKREVVERVESSAIPHADSPVEVTARNGAHEESLPRESAAVLKPVESPALPRTDSRVELKALRSEVLRQQDKMRGMEVTIKRLEAELQLARTTAAKNDEFKITANLASTGDMGRNMENLNSEIFHIATVLSDSERYPRPTANDSAKVFQESGAHLSHLVGPELVRYLANAKPCDVPDVVVQMMLQAAMANWCIPILDSWVCGANEGNIDRMFVALFGTVRASEDPNDASRWRVITRKNAQDIFTPQIKDLREDLLRQVTTVLKFTNARIDGQAVDSLIRERADAVVGSVLHLNRTIGAQIVSDDLHVTSISPGAKFDPIGMESMWEDGKKKKHSHANDVVVLTSGLGIAKKVPRSSDRIIPLLRSKVLLRLDLKELLGPLE